MAVCNRPRPKIRVVMGVESLKASGSAPRATPQAAFPFRRRDERMPLECAGDIGLCHIMKLRLTCDHRILCCADARGFLRRIKELLKQPPAMSL